MKWSLAASSRSILVAKRQGLRGANGGERKVAATLGTNIITGVVNNLYILPHHFPQGEDQQGLLTIWERTKRNWPDWAINIRKRSRFTALPASDMQRGCLKAMIRQPRIIVQIFGVSAPLRQGTTQPEVSIDREALLLHACLLELFG